MTIADLKDQLASTAHRIGSRVQDTPAYVRAKDAFDGLSPSMQRLVILLAAIFSFAILLALPMSWWSESDAAVAGFENRRQILREMLKVSRELNEMPDIPMPPPAETLRGDVEARAKQANLIEEQLKSVDVGRGDSQIIADKAGGGLIVTLSKLNVTQLVNIGASLSGLGPAVKLNGVEVKADREDPRYFNVIYHLTTLAVPDLSAPPPEAPEPPAKKPAKGKKPAAGGDE